MWWAGKTPFSRTLSHLATLDDLAGRHEMAIQGFRDAYSRRFSNLAENGSDRLHGKAAILDRLGSAALLANRLAVARRAYGSALELYRQLDRSRDLAVTTGNLGWLELYGCAEGSSPCDPLAAVGHFDVAQAGINAEDHPDQWAIFLTGKARALRHAGRLEEAETTARKGLARVEALRMQELQPLLRTAFLARHHALYDELMTILMRRHRVEPGVGHDLRALGVAESGRARSLLERTLSEPGMARDAEELSPGPEDMSAAAELAKLRREVNDLEHRRLEKIDRLTCLHTVEPEKMAWHIEEIAELERRLNQLLLAAEDPQRTRRAPSPDSAPGLVAPAALQERLDPAALQERLDPAALQERLDPAALQERLDPAALQERLDPAALQERLDPAALQERLDAHTALLVYALGQETSFLWWIDRQITEVFDLPARSWLEPRVRQAHRALAESGQIRSEERQRAIDEMERELSHTLLGPVAERLASRRLVIFPDGVLHTLPFAALPHPTDGQSLVEHHETVTLPSIALWDVLERREAARAMDPAMAERHLLTVLADSVYSVHDQRLAGTTVTDDDLCSAPSALPETAKEAEYLGALVAPEQRREYLAFDANRQTFLSGALSFSRIVHLAVHGELNEARPELSYLELSRYDSMGRRLDSRVFTHELDDLTLHADLMVLSACNTGRGKVVQGEGVVGMAQAVLAAGASRALVSLWPVDDETTAELMRSFYQALLERGASPADALRQAQRAMRRNERRRGPFYWAGFVLVGDWRWPDGSSMATTLRAPAP